MDAVEFAAFYRKLPDQESTMRFFERGDGDKTYYTVHGAVCQTVVQQYMHTQQGVRWLGPKQNPLATCNVNTKLFRGIVSDLWRRARVEVWTQPAGEKWSVAKRSSPGDAGDFEDIIAETGDSAVTGAIKWKEVDGKIHVAAALCNGTQRQFGVSEFTDGGQMPNLEAFLIQTHVRECVVAGQQRTAGDGSAAVRQAVQAVLKRLDIVFTEQPRNDSNPGDAETVVRPLLKPGAQFQAVHELRDALGSLVMLTKYMRLGDDHAEQYGLGQVDLQQYMRLDVAAVSALLLFPTPSQMPAVVTETLGTGRRVSSLYELLNHCSTRMGSRVLRQFITQPLRDVMAIRRRQDLVSIFVEDVVLKQAVQSILKGIPDLDYIVKALLRKNARLYLLLLLKKLLIALPGLCETLSAYDGACADVLKCDYVTPLLELGNVSGQLSVLIDSTVEKQHGEAVMKASFDDEMGQLKKKIDAVDEGVERVHEDVCGVLGLDSRACKLEKTSQFGWCMRVTRQRDGVVRSCKDLKVVDTRKDGVKFTNDTLMGLNRERTAYTTAYDARQETLVGQLMETVASYGPVIEDISSHLSTLDALVSFAHATLLAPIPYERPTVLPAESSCLYLPKARHPIVELQAGSQFIPNDVYLSREKGGILQLITGPNMGGKSTYIRTAGLLQHMSQIGMYLPTAAGAKVSVKDSILARLGASDCQVRGVSTFMAEMGEVATIQRSATCDSLLVIDELGRGTSTHDGFGLAWAIAKDIALVTKAFCLFATHFHELTTMATEYPGVVSNLHVAAAPSDHHLTMLYDVRPGPSQESYGLHVAQIARFPQKVLDSTRRVADELRSWDLGSIGRADPALMARIRELSTQGEAGGEAGTEPPAKRARVWRPTVEKLVAAIRAKGCQPDDELTQLFAEARISLEG